MIYLQILITSSKVDFLQVHKVILLIFGKKCYVSSIITFEVMINNLKLIK